jgi:hypothetical protein
MTDEGRSVHSLVVHRLVVHRCRCGTTGTPVDVRAKGAIMPPYRFGRHAITEKLDEYVGDPARAAKLLKEIRAKRPDTDFSATLLPEDRDHLLDEVYEGAPLTDTPQDDEEVERGRRRRLLYRDGIRAALELALHIDHDSDVPEDPQSIDPIDVFWGCGQPFDQAWIGWRTSGGTRRLVLVFFSDTPAMGWDGTTLADLTGSFPPATVAEKGLVLMYADGDGGTRISQVVQTDPAGGSE